MAHEIFFTIYIFRKMPSKIVNQAFRFSTTVDSKNNLCFTHMLKNFISPRFLCNSDRFSQITQEGSDYMKNLEIIHDFCPLEMTKNFEKLRFCEKIHYGIIGNCSQLINLDLQDIYVTQQIISKLPITIEILKIENKNIPLLDLTEMINLKQFTLICNDPHKNQLQKLPVSLEYLDIIDFAHPFDMVYLPFLKTLDLSIRYAESSTLKFLNSENHNLQKLTLWNYKSLENCMFPNLTCFETNGPVIGSSFETLTELKIPIDSEMENFRKFTNVSKLTLQYSIPIACNAVERCINFHDVFPKLEVFDNYVLSCFDPLKISFSHAMKKVTAELKFLSNDVISDCFCLFHPVRYIPETITISENIYRSKGKISFYDQFKSPSKIFATVYFDNGIMASDNDNVKIENNTIMVIRKL